MTQLQEKSPYEEHRDYVLAVLSRRCGWLAGDEREAVFHDAYAVMLEKERDGRLDSAAMHSNQVRAFITQTAIHKALDEGKRAERNRSEPLGDRAFAEPDGTAAPDELAAASLDNARVREIVDELSARQQTIVKLRFFFDRAPDEIQQYLGISERAYRRELERALRQVSERYDLVRQGRFCESRKSLILAFVGGFAGPNRALEARRHLSTCPGCAHWAAELRAATDRAAAVLPLPPLVVEQGLLSRVSEAVVGLVTRADPGAAGYATAVRPGTVAAAVAGCIALGGGATYCAVEGLPTPVRSLLPDARAEDKDRPRTRKAKAEPKRDAVIKAAPIATPAQQPVKRSPRKKAQSQPQAPARTATPAPTPVPQAVQEFGLEGSGEPVPSGGGSAPSSPPPSNPPGEFDP